MDTTFAFVDMRPDPLKGISLDSMFRACKSWRCVQVSQQFAGGTREFQKDSESV